MNKLTTTVNYSKTSKDSTPLIVEQEEWSLYTGKVTKQEVVKYLLSLIKGEDYDMLVDCGMAGDELVVAIYCYPLTEGLNYELYTSYGTLSERYSEIIEIDEELIQFRLSDSETSDYPARKIKNLEWVLQCLDANGDEIENPTLVTDGDAISTNGIKVYGTAKISYTCERHSYILTAPRRESALDNNYSGVIVGIVTGYSPVVVELDMPPTVASFINNSSYECGGYDTGFIDENDKEEPIPEVPSRNLVTIVDYCSQKPIREYLE